MWREGPGARLPCCIRLRPRISPTLSGLVRLSPSLWTAAGVDCINEVSVVATLLKLGFVTDFQGTVQCCAVSRQLVRKAQTYAT